MGVSSIAKKSVSPDISDPAASAKAAGLRYVIDSVVGIHRKKSGKGFRYSNGDGKAIRDASQLRRIKSLVIPPAWTDVWICPLSNGHLQATGRDARGRKQHRYHPKWKAIRDENKFERMMAFGKALPSIRDAVDKHLSVPDLPREKVLATVVRLLEMTLIRIGNEEYAKANNSYGLTTFRSHHVSISGINVKFQFRGKSGKTASVKVQDRRVAKIIRLCQDLPGQELFHYLHEDGELRTIDSGDVNDYLRQIANDEFTAKDFRTWAATVLAAIAFHRCEACESSTQAKKNVVRAVEAVAKKLRNTPTICRKSYIHPAIIDGYLDGSMAQLLKLPSEPEISDDLHALEPVEAAVLLFLQRKLAQQAA